MESAFADKFVLDTSIRNNVFHTIYADDIFDKARETYAQNVGGKMDRKGKKWFFKVILIIGLVCRWMPVWVVRDGNGVSGNESD